MTYILSLVKPVNLEVNKTITLRNFFGHIDIFGIRYITVNNFWETAEICRLNYSALFKAQRQFYKIKNKNFIKIMQIFTIFFNLQV